MKESFVFYKSFYDAIKKLPQEYQLELYNAILSYSLEGIEPSNLSPIAEAMFILIKPNIDSAQKRYDTSVENGKKGGAPKGNNNAKKQPENNLETTQKQPNNNLKATQEQPENNLNDNVDVNVDDNNIYPSSDDEELRKHFELIWEKYPNKKGKSKSEQYFLQWLRGRKINGTNQKLTDEQMYYAVIKYKKECEEKQLELQFIKHGDTFFNTAILDYVEEQNE